jgi:uncharacterized protein HemX
MTAQPWYDDRIRPVPPTRPALRLVGPDEVVAPAAGARRRAPAERWELTRRGQALVVAGLALLVATAVGTLVWGFLQVSNAPLS